MAHRVVYDTSERIAVTLPTSLYEKLVLLANENMRSISSQTAIILKRYFEKDIVQGIHHNKSLEPL